MVLTGVTMKSPKDMNYVLVGCNLFIEPPKKMKGFPIMIEIQETFLTVNKS